MDDLGLVEAVDRFGERRGAWLSPTLPTDGRGTLVPFELVTRGACVFIDIDSPLEHFERRYILQMEDSPIDCTDLKNRANSVKLSRTQETKRPNLLASLFSWAN